MSSPAKSADTLHALMQLRCRQEVLERWLASEVLPAGLQQSLHAMLAEVRQQLSAVTDVSPRQRVDISGEGRGEVDREPAQSSAPQGNPSGGGLT